MKLPVWNTIRFSILSFFLIILSGCIVKSHKTNAISNTPTSSIAMLNKTGIIDSLLITRLLKQHPEWFQIFLDEPAKYKMQISYTQIDRDSSNSPHFTHYHYRSSAEYTYPASTVKLPAAVLSLEKLNQIKVPGLSKDSYMFTDPIRVGEKPVYNDPTSFSGKPSVAHYIKKILLVSDNDAFNRLYEFLGQEAINDRLHALGYIGAEIRHRLSTPLNDVENRMTNPVWFMDDKGNTPYRQPFQLANRVYPTRTDAIGEGYMATDPITRKPVKIDKPLDFSMKNRWSLKDSHKLIQNLMFPECQSNSQKLFLTPHDYAFLWKYMSMLPGESDFPKYDSSTYWPAYVKFLLLGSQKGDWPFSNIRIFNKVGDAYGHLLDAAYIVDFDNKVEFILSAVVYCNSNEILNDDTYEYETTGFPFMKHLGQVFYEYERLRPKKYLPELSRYKMIPYK